MLISAAYAQSATGAPDSDINQDASIFFMLLIAVVWFIVYRGRQVTKREIKAQQSSVMPSGQQKQSFVKIYRGKQTEAAAIFQGDSASLGSKGYVAISQNWTPGTYSGGAFFVAFLLCFVGIGVLVFIYMLIVKPPGALSVTYELRRTNVNEPHSEEKTCPKCAEQVKAAATACRFCGYEFIQGPV